MEAEANGIERRAAALSQNQESVIAQEIAEHLPEIVRAAASSFDNVGSFTVLNGAQGVTAAMAEVIQQAGALAGIARRALAPAALPHDGQTNGTGPVDLNGAGPAADDGTNGARPRTPVRAGRRRVTASPDDESSTTATPDEPDGSGSSRS